MPAADYLIGFALFIAMLAPTFAGAWLLLRRRYGQLRGAEALTAFGVLAAIGVLVVHLAPAAIGLLGRGSVLIAALAWLGACSLVPHARPAADPAGPADDDPAEDDQHGRYAMPLAAAAVALIALFALTLARDQLTVVSGSIDFNSFHLPNVVGWIQTGSIWQVDNFLPSVAPGNYPNSGDVMLLAVVLPWHNDFLAHSAMWGFYALTAVATYAVALRLGALRAPAIVAGCLILAIPAVAIPAVPYGLPDSVTLFGFVAGLLFLLRHDRTQRPSELVLAGLALGLAFGAKWYGVSTVAVVIVVWALARLLAGRGWRQVLTQGAALVGLVALAGGIWMLRNWIVSGNPVFPVKVDPFGITIFDAPPDIVREAAGFSIADYVGDWDVWWRLDAPGLPGELTNGIVLQWWQALAAPALLIVAVALFAGVRLIQRRARHRAARGPLAAVAVCAGLIGVAYAVTPYTAGGPEGFPFLVGADSRYVVPALVAGATLAAWAAGSVRWGAVVFCALGLLAIGHGVAQSSSGDLAPVVLSARDWALTVGAVALIGGLGWLLRPWVRRLAASPARRAIGTVAVVGIGLAAVAVGYEVQQRFNDSRYSGADQVFDTIVQASEEPINVGLAGVWSDAGISPILPSFGPRFENHVEYVGPLIREMQQRYETRREFGAALERGNYDLLVVGRGRTELPTPPELAWASAEGWEVIATSDRLRLFAPA